MPAEQIEPLGPRAWRHWPDLKPGRPRARLQQASEAERRSIESPAPDSGSGWLAKELRECSRRGEQCRARSAARSAAGVLKPPTVMLVSMIYGGNADRIALCLT